MAYKILEDKNCSYELDGVTYEFAPACIDNVLTILTEEQALEKAQEQKEYNSKSAERKLERIKEIRLGKLEETDWWAVRDNMTDEQKAWRQSLRDIPANFTTEAEYDSLLEWDDSTSPSKPKHSIWKIPE